MLTLLRNVANSIGISVVIAELTEGSRRVYAVLSAHVTPFNNALQTPDVRSLIDLKSDAGRAMMDAAICPLRAHIGGITPSLPKRTAPLVKEPSD
jgi:DHA2 family multidrug resistance protein